MRTAPLTLLALFGSLPLLAAAQDVPAACSGHGIAQLGKCFCEPGYSGDACEIAAKCPADCSGRGQCSFGKCFCEPGRAGDDCAKPVACANDCSGNGVCHLGRCFCDPGHAGDDCAKPAACANDCSKRGICQRGMCFCDPGYEGAACEKPAEGACPADCSKRGICAYGKCFCKPGFAGSACEKPVEPECPGNCSAHGVCSSGKCFCVEDHGGVDCSEAPRVTVLVETPHYSATLLRSTGPRKNVIIVKNINVIAREIPLGDGVGDVLDDATVDEALFLPVNQGGTTQTFLRVSFRPAGVSSDERLLFVMPVSDEQRRRGRTIEAFAREEYPGDRTAVRRMRDLQDDLRCVAMSDPEFALEATGWYAEALSAVPGATTASLVGGRVMPLSMPRLNMLCGPRK